MRLRWAIGVAVFVIATLAAIQIFLAEQRYGADLWAYVLAGRHLLAGEPLYPPNPEVPFGPLGEYHYPPATAVPFMLLAPLPFWLATAIGFGLNIGMAAAIGVHLIRPLPRDAQPWAAACFVLFFPTTLEIKLGQLSLLTVALCLVAWSLRRRPVLGGVILAIAIGIKLLPATLVLFYLASRQWRLMFATLVTGAVGLVFTLIVFARDVPIFLGILAALRSSPWTADFIASGSPKSVAELVGSPVATALLPIAAVVTAIAGGLLAHRDPRHETHLHHLALAFAPYIAPFGLIWYTYLVTALPLLASTLQYALLARGSIRVSLVALLALTWLLLQAVGKPDDIMPVAAHLLGLLLLLALGILVLVLGRAPQPMASAASRPATP